MHYNFFDYLMVFISGKDTINNAYCKTSLTEHDVLEDC
jgi:hypothetical protein